MFQDHILRHHLQELRGAQHLGQLSDDAEVRHEDVERLLRDHHLHVSRRCDHSRRPRLELGLRLSDYSLLLSLQNYWCVFIFICQFIERVRLQCCFRSFQLLKKNIKIFVNFKVGNYFALKTQPRNLH